MITTAELKQQLRKTILNKFKLLPFTSEIRLQAAKDAAKKLGVTDFYKNSSLILIFLSLDSEIDTSSIIKQAIADNKKIAIPRVIKNTNEMNFYLLKNNIPITEQTEKNEWGISEPILTLEKIFPEKIPENTLIVVPGLAFSKNGKRLGRGKGFYDRYLEKVSHITAIGLCYSFQLLNELPSEDYDQKVDYIITESSIDKV